MDIIGKSQILSALSDAAKLLQGFLADEDNILKIAAIADTIVQAYAKGGKVIIFGNGGSMCDAMHFAEELTGRFRENRPALPAIAISDPSHITCVANDFGFAEIFARGVEAYFHPHNVVIGLSTSGNSENVYRALLYAQERGNGCVALLGGSGGKLKGLCQHEIIVPTSGSDRIQEIHTLILHILVEQIELRLFSQNKED